MARFKEPAQLHNHSKYSLLDAVPSSEEWVHWCLENDTPGFAVTDHGTAISMYDALQFPKYIESYNKKHGTNYPLDKVIGIPAVELYVVYNKGDKRHYHITVWATSNQGYFNLSKLSSLAFEDTVSRFGNIKARVTFDQIVQYKEGLKIGTGCIAGPIGSAIMHEDSYELAEQRFVDYMNMFGDQLYIEFHPTDITHDFNRKTGEFDRRQPTECDCDANAQLAYNLFLKDMVNKYGGKPIPVTDAHFIAPEDKIVQDCLLKNGNDNGWYFYESYHQKRSEEMFTFLADQLGSDWLTEERFASWIENTYEVMNAAKNIKIDFEYHMPKIEIPEHIQEYTDDYDLQTYYLTVELCKKHGRWKDDPVYIERFKKEIGVIMKNDTLNFLPYFLLYEDIGAYARSIGILQGVGRGSAGGCLLSYYLKIIHIDPIKENLPFERFLSHARIRAGSFPDIDADFGDRTEIIKYLEEKYGLGFAQIATFQRMKVKNAIKDAMWALYGYNRNHPVIRDLCETIPDSPQGVDEKDFLYGFTDKEGNYHMGQVETNKKLADFLDAYPDVKELMDKLIGIVRGVGRHASAFVVSTVDLASSRVPTMLMKDSKMGKKVTVTQFDANMVESRGLVKADILGVTTIDAVSKCVAQIDDIDLLQEDKDGMPAIYRLPEDDSVYSDFYNKSTDSSFQFGTNIIKGYVEEFCPLSRKDLSDFTALCRPGAMDAPIVNDDLTEEDNVSATQYYMDVRNGKRQLSYVHPDLEPYTTNGAFVYQEQIMEFLVDFAGYTLEESDQVRGAIAKKKREIMLEAFDRIRIAAEKRGWTPTQIETVNKQVEAFSRYSFNKSHSRCYAELGYITMYLKNKFPLQWWSAILNTAGEDKVRYYMTLLSDKISSPSITNATSEFKVADGKIVAPLSSIKGIGPAAIDEMVTKAPFKDLDDFLMRVDHRRFNKGSFGKLVGAGAAKPFYNRELIGVNDIEARIDLLNRYQEARKSKSQFADELFSKDPLDIFLLEKKYNTCFAKTLLVDESVSDQIALTLTPFIDHTERTGVPFVYKDLPVIRDITVAKGLIKKGYDKDVTMIVMFKSSQHKSITAKKTGKKYNLRETIFTDGLFDIKATEWKKTFPLVAKENSLFVITGTLENGWRDQPQINIKEMEEVSIGKLY